MKITILGTRGEIEEFAPKHKKHSGILIDNILFDLGEKEYLELKPKAIFLTHLHPDHAYFVKEKEMPNFKDIKVYAPESFQTLHIIKLKKAQPITVDSMTVIPIPTIHSKKVKSTAYLIRKNKRKVLYTGDMIWIRKTYHDLLRDLDLVITDGSFNRKGGMIRRDKETGEIYGHQGIPNLVDLFKKLGTKRIIFTHFGEWLIKNPEKGKEEIKQYSNTIKVEAATDGKVIELEESSLGTTGIEEVEPVSPRQIVKIQPQTGLYLVKPHAQMIMSGEKTLIVKSKKFTSHINEPLYLIEDSLCYGVITLKEPQEISPEEFEKLRDRHRITDREAFEHWGWKKEGPLYAYEFNINEKFDPPLPVKIPQGVQVFVDAKNIKFLEIKNLSILDLFDYADLEISDELFAQILEELHDRNIHKSQVIDLIRGWISEYDPKTPNDRQLGDDFRICVKPDTPVLTDSGVEFIANAKPDSLIKEVMRRYVDEDLITIKPRYLLPFSFTREHPILILPLSHKRSNGNVVPKYSCQRLRDSHGRFVWSRTSETPRWKPADEVGHFDGVCIPKLPSKPTSYSKELLELAGWYVAEGYPDKDTLHFSLHEREVDIANRIIELARKITGCNNGTIQREKNKKAIRVNFNSQELVNFFVLNFGKGARNKTIPKWLLEATPEETKIFLDAFYKGDGWQVGNYLKVRTASKRLAVGLWYLWTKLGKIGSLTECLVHSNFGSFQAFELSISKQQKPGYWFEDEKAFWLPVTRISKEHFCGEVYNLHTKTETYQVPFVVHNCLAWYSSIRRGKKLFKRVGDEKKEITLEDCKQLALKIFKEMIRRGFTFNKPSTYKKYARELFEWLISQVGEDKIPWKEEEKAKTVPEVSKIDIKDLEDIDDVFVASLTDEQLMTLHHKLHEMFAKLKRVTEPLQNAHIFVWKEIRKRKLPHSIEDGLDRATSLEVIEYPEPEEGIPQQISLDKLAKTIELERVLKAFPEQIIVEDPIHVYLCGRVVNEGKIPESHDLDLLFKQGWYHVPTVNAFLEAVSKRDPEVAKRFHFVWDSLGPHIGYTVPLFRLAFIRVSPEEMKRTSPFEFLAEVPTLFKPYIGLKPKSGFEKNEFWDIKEMWEKWAKDYIDKGIIIQKKFDGMRFQIHCKGDQVKAITEDRQRDRASVFKKSIAELLKNKKADSFIIDVEMVEYACDKETNRPDLCEQLPREEMIKWIGAEKKELDDENVVFHIHDCTFINGEAINTKGYEERWNVIDKIIPPNLKHWKKVDGEVARDMREFFKLVKKYRALPNSEGVVAKSCDSVYPIKYSGENRTPEWAKLKNLKEIDVMVWKVIQKKTKEGKPLDQYLYECVFSIPCKDKNKFRTRDIVEMKGKCYLWIGRSYATGEKVSPGTIIIVRPIRIAKFKDPNGKIYYTWMFPYYDGKHPSKTEPDSIDVVEKLVKVGTGPLEEEMGTLVFRLPECPFWNDENICILKNRFRIPRDNLTKVKIEYLKYPIVCRFANHYRCRFVKSYYYGFKEGEVKSEVDEDTGEEINENQA